MRRHTPKLVYMIKTLHGQEIQLCVPTKNNSNNQLYETMTQYLIKNKEKHLPPQHSLLY